MSDHETIRLTGVVRGAGLLCGDLKLRIEEGFPVEKSVRLGFELETDTGQRVKVLADEARLIGEDRERRGTYGELGDDPRLACFETRPGPHVRTELGGPAVFAGDRVAILAEVNRRGYLEGGADYRSAPAEQILEVKATRIACGPDAEKQLVEPPAERAAPAEGEDAAASSGWMRRNVLALILALAAVLALVLPLAGAARGATAGLLLVMAVLIVRRRGAPRFHPLASHPGRESWDDEAERFPSGAGLVVAFIMAALAWPAVTFAPLPPTLGRLLGVAMVGLPALVGFFYLHVRSAPSLRRLRAMLEAAPLREQSGEAFGALVGALVSPLEGARQKLALYSFFTFTSGEQVTTGSGTETRVHHRIAERTEVRPSLALRTDGKEIKVSVEYDVRWASTEQGRSMRSWKAALSFFTEPHATHDHFITPGSQALAVGRLQAGELASTGPESLLIFASGTRNPRAVARAEITYHWLTAAVLLLLLGLPALWW